MVEGTRISILPTAVLSGYVKKRVRRRMYHLALEMEQQQYPMTHTDIK
jgi:hypothetical protein